MQLVNLSLHLFEAMTELKINLNKKMRLLLLGAHLRNNAHFLLFTQGCLFGPSNLHCDISTYQSKSVITSWTFAGR